MEAIIQESRNVRKKIYFLNLWSKNFKLKSEYIRSYLKQKDVSLE